MTYDEMKALWARYRDDYDNNEYGKFERVAAPRSRRPDLHAFLLLDELCPGTKDMVSAAEHDEIYLEVDPEDVAERITPEQVLELVRCGVRLTSDGFALFV